MAIVVADVHGNVEKVRAFLAYKPETEHVALGDYVDSFFEPPSRQLIALQLLLASDAALLWGNHDLHYLKIAPWFCTGRQYEEALMGSYSKIYSRHKKRFLAAHVADGWLCTHAGVSTVLQQGLDDVSAIADMLNADFAKWLKKPVCFQMPSGDVRTTPASIFNIGQGRGGGGRGGIFWFDFKRESGLAPVKQIFGHTEVTEPVVTETFVALDTTNNKNICWVYDTQTNELVALPMERRIALIADLPEDEQGPFSAYLLGRTVPLRGGYFEEDYMRWQRDPDGW